MEKILNYIKIGLVSLSLLMVLMYSSDLISLGALINFSLFLLGLVVVSTLAMSGLNFAENPKKGKSILVGMVALLLFYFVSLGFSEYSIDTTTQTIIKGSKQAEAGIYTLYFVLSSAIAALIYSSAKRIIK